MNLYHGKLLLFGEYTIIHGGHSLAMPLKLFFSNWSMGTGDNTLLPYAEYLKLLNIGFDHDAFTKDIEKGLYFHSNIPNGYGCGSSGALVAATYKEYCTECGYDDLSSLKKILASMESYFHGKSSGIDPLVILLNQPLFSNEGRMKIIEENIPLNDWKLYDSGIERTTSVLVNQYIEMISNSKGLTEKVDQLKQINNKLINRFLKNEGIREMMCDLSELQFDLFRDFIPSDVAKLWELGLEKEEYYFKLCGAGGGGFFLVYGDIAGENIIDLN
jgi:mevalonate kinase